MNETDVRTQIIEHLVRGVAAARKCFDKTTGRFLAENGGWEVTRQDVIYPLALLFTTPHPANPFHNDEEILDMACRGGDALRDWQDEDGRVVFIRPTGQRWGKTYMPRSMYHWLEAYALLRDRLSPERAHAWEKGLRLAYAGIAIQNKQRDVTHNIAAWNAMALVRAAKVLDEPSWREIGERYIHHVCSSQHPDGYWPEGAGPTVGYNLVYVHAVGLYYHFTGDESVLPALERAADFHLRFTYPNGACVETIDGRVKYKDQPSRSGMPGFLVSAEGRRFVRFQMECLRRRSPEGALIPHLASAFVHFSDGSEAPIPQEQDAFVAVHHGHALVRRKKPWFYCLSGYTTPTEALHKSRHTRWHMDRQNLLSVWHDGLGLIIGGGSSKNQPEFSTFAVQEGRVRWVQPCAAAVSADDTAGDRLRLQYGGVGCTLTVHLTTPDTIEFVFQADAAADGTGVRAGFTMRPRHGTKIETSHSDEPFTVDACSSFGQAWPEHEDAAERWITGEGWRVDMPQGSGVAWPVYPFNPYAIDNAAPPGQAVLRVFLDIEPGGPAKETTLRVNV